MGVPSLRLCSRARWCWARSSSTRSAARGSPSTHRSSPSSATTTASRGRCVAPSSRRPRLRPGNAAGASIRALEQARAENERHMFEQAVNDLRALPGSVVEKLEDLVQQRLGQLRVPTSFLEESNQGSRTLANEGNIRVVASPQPAPSVQALVGAMQHRRSISETLASYKIASIKLEALQAMNAKVQQVLGKVTKNSQAAFLSLRSHAQGARGKTSTSTSDFEVLVHPPEETTDEIRESLDTTMRAENAKLSMALAEFAKEKQDLANLEKQELRDIVR